MTSRKQRGFTLIEVIIFIVVVGAGLAGVLSVFNTAVKSSADPVVRKQALAIAESLLEEITLKEYSKPNGSTVLGFAAGGSRALFDCVDDFNGYTTASGVTDLTGTAFSGLTTYRIFPAVSVSTTTLGTNTVKRVVVQVTDPQGNVIALTGYRGNY